MLMLIIGDAEKWSVSVLKVELNTIRNMKERQESKMGSKFWPKEQQRTEKAQDEGKSCT